MRAELELPPEESEARLAGAANLVCVEDERLDPVENDSAETAILTLFDEVDDVFATLPLFEMGPELIREAQTVVEPESVSEIVQELPDFAHAENGQLTIARALSLVAPTAKMNDRVDAVELREAESTDAVGAELNWAMMFRERSFDESVDEKCQSFSDLRFWSPD